MSCPFVNMGGGVVGVHCHFQQYFNTVYRGGQFYWWRKPEYQEKTTDMPQINFDNEISLKYGTIWVN